MAGCFGTAMMGKAAVLVVAVVNPLVPGDSVPPLGEQHIGLSYRAEKSISLFVAHKFEIREFPSKYDDLKCIFEEYRTVRVKVTDRQDQKVVINPDFSITYFNDRSNTVRVKVTDRQDQKVVINPDFSITYFNDRSKASFKADNMFTRCEERAKAASIADPLAFIEQVQKEEELGQEEDSFHSAAQRSVAADLISFECGDVKRPIPSRSLTQPFSTTTQTWDVNLVTRYEIYTNRDE
eukprot:CAMPEP_0168312120 /NCGR_PEP_ID=MMETSP0142_2-20121227/67734_1 /TAXON_ID=44445 /ORGANISM="Pseudo-nitzschia australis, Strain 10249 10 AB" /LENGTH=236 /DNA_ID=CAMNT_0008265071 /DNA_START=138 /DNA_END=848 /DNA_ORIENTATION=+